ncbi:hypothetical protein BC827DRAFT_1212144, partial [Russula dissimulans]
MTRPLSPSTLCLRNNPEAQVAQDAQASPIVTLTSTYLRIPLYCWNSPPSWHGLVSWFPD